MPCLGLKSGTLGGTARHESLFVPRRAVPSRAVPRRAWAGSCRAAHLAIYRDRYIIRVARSLSCAILHNFRAR